MRWCEYCGGPAGEAKNFRDPRRSELHDDAVVRLFFCRPECEAGIVDSLERQARAARLVN